MALYNSKTMKSRESKRALFIFQRVIPNTYEHIREFLKKQGDASLKKIQYKTEDNYVRN